MPQNKQSEIRVRYAPSPTGHWHVGGVRVVLYNWLYARKTGGTFIVRIEDTDKERSESEFELEIFESMRWLGLDYDEGPVWTKNEDGTSTGSEKGDYGPYRQSERRDIYRNYLTQLIEKSHAYYCYCTKEDLEAERQLLSAQGLPPKYGGHCRNLTSPPTGKKPETIRFRIPETAVRFHDLIRGDVSFDASLFGDIVIAKDLDNPLYNFAVVVDDELMKISHIIRGEEHLSNTPKQVLLQKALGFRTPEYAHFPLILNPDRSKMSKRYGETALSGYRDAGYLSEAMVNFFLLQGWHPKDNREVMTPREAAELFEFKDVQKAGAVFSEDKLNWMNKEYLKKLSNEELAQKVAPFLNRPSQNGRLADIVGAVRDHMTILKDIDTLTTFFFELPTYAPDLLVWKKDTPPASRDALTAARDTLANLPEDRFTVPNLATAFEPLTVSLGRGSVLWSLRVALSGLAASPDPFVIAAILGKKEVISRVELALSKL
mgnify:FL=1